ncbi:hypothetical protein AB3S75_018422 [Citrus x aurantiifolia]
MLSRFSKRGVRNMRRKRRVKLSLTGRRLKQLKRMIPSGCSEMNMETLYQMTANYISLLQAKVSLLQSLSTFYGA